jgi:hypothetical protein
MLVALKLVLLIIWLEVTETIGQLKTFLPILELSEGNPGIKVIRNDTGNVEEIRSMIIGDDF